MRHYFKDFSGFSRMNEQQEEKMLDERTQEYVNTLFDPVTAILERTPTNGWKIDPFMLVSAGFYGFVNESFPGFMLHSTPFVEGYDGLWVTLEYDGENYEFSELTTVDLSKRLSRNPEKDVQMLADLVINNIKKASEPQRLLDAIEGIVDEDAIEWAKENPGRGGAGVMKIAIMSGLHTVNTLTEMAELILALPEEDHDVIINYVIPTFKRSEKAKKLFGI